jgi:hypothetical protein
LETEQDRRARGRGQEGERVQVGGAAAWVETNPVVVLAETVYARTAVQLPLIHGAYLAQLRSAPNAERA